MIDWKDLVVKKGNSNLYIWSYYHDGKTKKLPRIYFLSISQLQELFRLDSLTAMVLINSYIFLQQHSLRIFFLNIFMYFSDLIFCHNLRTYYSNYVKNNSKEIFNKKLRIFIHSLKKKEFIWYWGLENRYYVIVLYILFELQTKLK